MKAGLLALMLTCVARVLTFIAALVKTPKTGLCRGHVGSLLKGYYMAHVGGTRRHMPLTIGSLISTGDVQWLSANMQKQLIANVCACGMSRRRFLYTESLQGFVAGTPYPHHLTEPMYGPRIPPTYLFSHLVLEML